MKPKVKQTSCPDVLSNQCIVWEGGAVECLGICNGDQLSIAEKAIADKVCELAASLDLSDLDMSCVIEKSTDTDLVNVLQVLFDNQCTLKTLIDNIDGNTADVELSLNLKCLKKFDEFNNEIPQNLNQVLQSSVNAICQNQTDIISLNSRLTDLEEEVANIPIPEPQQEPSVATCLSPGVRPVSQVVPIIASEICEMQTTIGSIEQISAALALQCDNLNQDYTGTDGWSQTVANLAQAVGNMWIVICDLRDRIDLIETNCCAVTCSDIKIAFEVSASEDNTGIFLKFTEKAGTYIPIGFTDSGSKVVITDKVGNSVEYPIVITQGATLGDFDVTGLDLSDFLNIEVTAKFTSDSIGCEKCASRLYKMNNLLCPYCEILVSGDADAEIVIVYED